MSPDPSLEARAQEAEDAWRRGDFARAYDVYTTAVRERLASALSTGDGLSALTAADYVVIERLADLARLFGHGASADELLAISIGQIRDAGNRFWTDLLQLKRIDLALGRGLLREAQALLSGLVPSIGDVTAIEFSSAGLAQWEAGCQWPGTGPLDRTLIFTMLCFVMGRLLTALGQYEQAQTSLERGLHHALRPDAPALARAASPFLRLTLAQAMLEKGESGHAETVLQRVPADERTEPAVFVRALELKGKLKLLGGDFGAALGCYRQVLDVCGRRGFTQASIAATLNLAHVLIFVNQTLEARERLAAVRERAAAAGDEPTVVRAEWLLALAAERGQSLADGVPIAPTVSEQWGARADAAASGTASIDAGGGLSPLDLPQSAEFLALYEDRAVGFFWLLGRRDFTRCAAYLDDLRRIFRSTDSELIHLRLAVLGGLLDYYVNEHTKAAAALDALRADLRTAGLRPELWQAQRVLTWCWRALGSPAEFERLTKDNDALLAAMTGTLAPADRSFFLLNKWTADEELLATEVNRLSALKAAVSSAPWRARLTRRWELRRGVERLQSLVDRHRDVVSERTGGVADDADAGPGVQRKPPARESIWRRLGTRGRRQATIAFLVLPDRVVTIRRTWRSLDFGVSAATRIEVRELVRRWHETVARMIDEESRGLGARPSSAPRPDADADARGIADRLSELLQLPAVLATLPSSIRAVTFVPDDSLHGFPFAALRHRGSHLIEHYAVSFAYHSSGGVAPAGTAAGPVLLVGTAGGGHAWPTLPFVNDEIRAVAQWAAGRGREVRRFQDADPAAPAPDPSSVAAALPRASIAHIACHGMFTPDEPSRSGIVLRPAEADGGLLDVRTLSSLDLTGVAHVTLSACWSADHFVLPGRWVISLPETLARAGAGSVLGSLWLVSDKVGAAFMTRFYHYLDTHSRAEALRRTQLDCLGGRLCGSETDTRAFVYWAGYQMYGDGGRFRL